MSQHKSKCRLTPLAALLAACGFFPGDLAAWQQPAPGVVTGPSPVQREVSQKYSPRFMRPAAPLPRTPGQYPVAQASYGQAYQEGGMEEIGQGYVSAEQGFVSADQGYVAEEGFVDEGYGDYFEEGSACGRCPTCLGGSPSDCYNCGPARDRRDCGIPDDCWMKGLGGVLCNSEYFFGAHGFKNQVFSDNTANFRNEDCGFGLNAGFNTGLPLYWLTCGIVTGQVGMNVVHSNFEDGFLSEGDRQQTFYTAGFFRRVDYGLQFGSVADILSEEWVSEFELVQMRSELSWVWSGGANLGFRWYANVQDDNEQVGDVVLNGIQSIDNYRFFYRYSCCEGGYAEAFYGRTDEQHSLYGVDFDLPISERVALQTGLTYMQPDEDLAFTDNEAWNLFIGLSFRPRGRDWYEFYHRPLFDVADNGNMILSRR